MVSIYSPIGHFGIIVYKQNQTNHVQSNYIPNFLLGLVFPIDVENKRKPEIKLRVFLSIYT